ncbi:hypothetical protein SBD_4218 [Streptomyces bottropensis ATCC 25435]|uniref:Uncharacterized protein n=1 Tax=Streptomyces bottropensis ATCC 25435 TaxID=1054862 RepID=M3FNL2_9ACTN|nr:hypothetical protein SBD_4218 [Streptomyces bottropensis ATCC 25435]
MRRLVRVRLPRGRERATALRWLGPEGRWCGHGYSCSLRRVGGNWRTTWRIVSGRRRRAIRRKDGPGKKAGAASPCPARRPDHRLRTRHRPPRRHDAPSPTVPDNRTDPTTLRP